MAKTRLIQGTHRSDRSRRVDGLVRDHWGRALLLVPTRTQAAERTESLLLSTDLRGAWGRPVSALTDFAEHLLVMEGKPLRRMDDLERGLLLGRVLDALQREDAIPGMPNPDTAPGLARHLLQVIVQLKQAAIEPEAFRKRLKEPAPFDRIVARVYEDYHDALVAADAYDVPGLFWQAHLTCLEGKPRALDDINLVALDGFDDFTPSELRFVEGLGRHVDQLVFGLNHDVAPDRQDLFALPRQTTESILSRFDAAEEVAAEPAPRCQRSWLASRIFWRDLRPYPDGLTENLAVLPCVDAAHETECVGRRIKTLLLEGVPPEEIAIIHRNPAEAVDRFTEVFAGYGIPLSARQGRPLRRSSVGGFLLRFFEAMQTWSREDMLEVLMSPWAHPGGKPDDGTPALARAAGIVRGARAWKTRLEKLHDALEARRGKDAERLLARMPHAAERAARLLERIAGLAGCHAALPREATQRDFAIAVDRLMDTLQLEQTARRAHHPEGEETALTALRGMLVTMASASGAAPIPWAVFLRRFEEGLGATSYTPPGPSRGVILTDPSAVRGLTFRHVFLVAMNEGVLPAPVPVNAVYSERDLERLRRAGIPLEGTWAHHARERLLFHHVLESATETLTLSWRAMKEGGREAMPSPFLADVREIFADRAEIEAPVPRSETMLPEADQAASAREFGAALAHAGAKPDDLAGLFPQAAHALTVESRRQDPNGFDSWDGVLADPALVNGLAAHYDNAHHFSANQVETHRACPFRFFLDRVLHVEEYEAPAEELDARTRGSMLHAILQQFHRRFQGRAIAAIPTEEATEALEEIVHTVFSDNRWRTITCTDGLMAMEERAMAARLSRYLLMAQNDGDDAEWAPRHFEVAFGRTPREEADPASVEKPHVLDTPAGEVLFAGVVDRIDAGAEDTLRIIDYKSGAVPTAGDVVKARDIQLSLYLEVVEQLLFPGKTCASAVYLVPGRTARRDVIPKKYVDRHTRREVLIHAVSNAVAGIRAGVFPPTPADEKKTCALCGQRSICRYDRRRVERKQEEPAS